MSELLEIKSATIAAVEVLNELTQQEEAERHRLELKVERTFHEAGTALRELRDRRLYRSTHQTFEEYCRDRFEMTRAAAYYLIDAATVMDNLLLKCQQIVDIFPTKESHCREVGKLEPDKQPDAWIELVKRTGGKKVPPARTIREIVQEVQERNNTPPPILYSKGSVVEIRNRVNSDLRKYSGCWGIVTHVGTWNCTVHIKLRNVDVQCKPNEMDKIDESYTVELLAVSERILALMQRDDLSCTAIAVLETLVRQTSFPPADLWLLSKLEEWHSSQ